ncbi:tetratricopeptide repeat protein [Legionella longbeachae]|uniref:tetratricopeptide repeat protein n=3 Tax=Legionella longbeachae TaxID=450 RepID=UPI0014055B15|nr:tetratricopeptide repeat protein [Legionella longbeachae]QIN30978.1 tetratricopeptide repeat protein [Legionella longbeachae]
MKRCLILLLFLFYSFSVHAFNWHDLWITPDQQGQELMSKNQFKEAQETFTRSDWAAAAAYRAGDYQKAAELYQNSGNEQGYYNEGNSLAHMGKYEEALKAYNKALAINSSNQDALYNRKLIEDLLKKEKEKNQNQQNKDQQNKDQQNKDQQNKDQQNKDQQNKDQQNKDQQNKDQQNKDQQNKDQQNKDQQNKDQQNKDQQNKDQQNKDQQNKDQQKQRSAKTKISKNKDQQNKDQQNKDQQNKDQQNKDQQNKDQQNKDQQNKKNQNTQATEPLSEAEREKQQAKEQWLRLIPDDPGGLMREKFLRDHLRRERGWYQ